jgi:hypothetical protein
VKAVGAVTAFAVARYPLDPSKTAEPPADNGPVVAEVTVPEIVAVSADPDTSG